MVYANPAAVMRARESRVEVDTSAHGPEQPRTPFARKRMVAGWRAACVCVCVCVCECMCVTMCL